MECEFAAPLLCPFNPSANGVMGTVAGTMINTLLYNPCEATLGSYSPTENLDVMIVESTEVTFGLDPLMGVTATGKLGTRKVHEMGYGIAMSCVKADTEE